MHIRKLYHIYSYLYFYLLLVAALPEEPTISHVWSQSSFWFLRDITITSFFFLVYHKQDISKWGAMPNGTPGFSNVYIQGQIFQTSIIYKMTLRNVGVKSMTALHWPTSPTELHPFGPLLLLFLLVSHIFITLCITVKISLLEPIYWMTTECRVNTWSSVLCWTNWPNELQQSIHT